MKATIELCHQKCRLIQACSHNQVGIYIMGVGGGRCIEASHFNKGWFSLQCQCGQSRSNNRHKEKKPDNFSFLLCFSAGVSSCLCTLVFLHLAALCFVSWSRRSRFWHVPCTQGCPCGALRCLCIHYKTTSLINSPIISSELVLRTIALILEGIKESR